MQIIILTTNIILSYNSCAYLLKKLLLEISTTVVRLIFSTFKNNFLYPGD